MNLIEQLGGYAQAKALRALPAETYDCVIKFNREELELSMLKYRREHNIFEVGDWVILPNRLYLDSLQKITFINKVHGLYQYTDGCCGYGQNIRHATDEEIKAGKRL